MLDDYGDGDWQDGTVLKGFELIQQKRARHGRQAAEQVAIQEPHRVGDLSEFVLNALHAEFGNASSLSQTGTADEELQNHGIAFRTFVSIVETKRLP
jgi:hypothetical protein